MNRIYVPYENRKTVEKNSKKLVEFFLKCSEHVVLTRRHEGKILGEILLEMERENLRKSQSETVSRWNSQRQFPIKN